MQVTTLKAEGTDFHAKIVISNDIINQEIQKSLNDLQKKAKLPGFRPGKVPLEILSKKYGDSVRSEVVDKQINNSIDNMIKDHKLDVATSPKLEELKTEEGQDIEFIIKLEILPEILMPEFDKISIEKPTPKIVAKEIKEELEKLAKNSIIYEIEKKDKAAKNDQVTIDAVGSIEGVPFEGGKLVAHKLVLGSKSFIDNFEDQLIGTKANDELIVKVNFPENYHVKDLAGKPAEFAVKILAIHEGKKPEFNEEFAQKFNCKTIEELEQNITKYIKAHYDNDVNTIMKMHLFNQLEEMLKFEVPASLLEKEYNVLKAQTEQITKEEESFKNKTPQELEEYYKKLAMRRVRIGLLLSEYAKAKDLKITVEDIKNAIMVEAKQFPGYENKIAELYTKNPKAMEQLKGSVLEAKAVKHIFAHEIKITIKEYGRKELEALINKETEESDIV